MQSSSKPILKIQSTFFLQRLVKKFTLKSGILYYQLLKKFKSEVDFIKTLNLNRWKQSQAIDEGLKHF